MTLFIIGCVLAGIEVISIPLFCVILLRHERVIKKLDWRFYIIMFAFLAIGIAAVALIFAGQAQMNGELISLI